MESIFSRVVCAIFAAADYILSMQFISGIVVGIVLFAVLTAMVIRRKYRFGPVTLNVPFGLGSIVLSFSAEDRALAWRMYVQLKTRKAALPFDDRHDVVADVHDSLYELFPVTRELLAGIPLSDVGDKHSVADLILRTLNDGLRPYLTQWHGRFRRWWEQKLIDNHENSIPFQELQREYPQYADLVRDLQRTNTELSIFAEELFTVAKGTRQKRQRIRVSAVPPSLVESKQVGIEPITPTPASDVRPPAEPYAPSVEPAALSYPKGDNK